MDVDFICDLRENAKNTVGLQFKKREVESTTEDSRINSFSLIQQFLFIFSFQNKTKLDTSSLVLFYLQQNWEEGRLNTLATQMKRSNMSSIDINFDSIILQIFDE